MTTAYRSLDPVVQEQVRQFHARRVETRDAIDVAREVLATRAGYAVAGGAATVFGILMFPAAFAPSRGIATLILGGGWLASMLLVSAVRECMLLRTASSLWKSPPLTGDPHVDLAYLQDHDPLETMRARARRWEHASAALPMTGLALLAPLTIHWLVKAVADAAEGRGASTAEEFGSWIALSALFVGLAHIMLATHAFVWTRSLRRRSTAAVGDSVHAAWMTALGLAVFAGFVPSAFCGVEALALLPPLLVAITGLTFVPFMYWATARRVRADRERLGD
jgi:hypothetical protein